jgi:hypothetical protein
MGIGDHFPVGKAAGAWSCPFASNWCRAQENVDVYIHSPHTSSRHSAYLVKHRDIFTLYRIESRCTFRRKKSRPSSQLKTKPNKQAQSRQQEKHVVCRNVGLYRRKGPWKATRQPLCLLLASRWFLAWLIHQPWRQNQSFPAKRHLIFNPLHCFIFQKVEFFVSTAVRTCPYCCAKFNTLYALILWGIGPLLGKDYETNNEYTLCYAIGQ